MAMPTGVGITGLGLGNLLRLVGLERTCPVLADLPTILDTFLPVGFLVPNFPLSLESCLTLATFLILRGLLGLAFTTYGI